MRITKILNNSIVLAEDETGQEHIIMGKAIGFHNKSGNTVKLEEIEKIYVLKDEKASQRFAKLVADIPEIYFGITDHIIKFAQEQLQCELNDHIFIALTDHIHFAITRYQESSMVQNRLFWEVKKFYPKEYKVGLYAIQYINSQMNVELPEEEAGNITFHLLNAQQNEGDTQNTILITTIIKDILNIVKYHFGIEMEAESINYSRFVTHLQFFAQRLLENKTTRSVNDDFLFTQVKEKFQKELECVKRIEEYVHNKLGKSLSKDERIYLSIHINRVTNR
jgi:beta-glucoside operon transcriptional antiterminator